MLAPLGGRDAKKRPLWVMGGAAGTDANSDVCAADPATGGVSEDGMGLMRTNKPECAREDEAEEDRAVLALRGVHRLTTHPTARDM